MNIMCMWKNLNNWLSVEVFKLIVNFYRSTLQSELKECQHKLHRQVNVNGKESNHSEAPVSSPKKRATSFLASLLSD